MATPAPVAPPPTTIMSHTPGCAPKRRYISDRVMIQLTMWRRHECLMPLPTNGNSAEVVGQVDNLRRVGNPPEPPVNKPAGACCQPARRIPSCPTINAGCSASRKLSGIGHECLRHVLYSIRSEER